MSTQSPEVVAIDPFDSGTPHLAEVKEERPRRDSPFPTLVVEISGRRYAVRHEDLSQS